MIGRKIRTLSLELFGPVKAFLVHLHLKTGEVYAPETSCLNETSVHIKNMWIKQLCNRKVRDFAMAFRTWKFCGSFSKPASGYFRQMDIPIQVCDNWKSSNTGGSRLFFQELVRKRNLWLIIEMNRIVHGKLSAVQLKLNRESVFWWTLRSTYTLINSGHLIRGMQRVCSLKYLLSS